MTTTSQTSAGLAAAKREPLIVGFATTGRADVLARTIQLLEAQTLKPDQIIVSAITPGDTDGVREGTIPLTLLYQAKGLCAQRNVILDHAPQTGVVQFFDDDFLPSPTYLEEIAAAFTADNQLVAATGHVLRDGIGGPGFDFETGLQALHDNQGTHGLDEPVFNGYGCNFAFSLIPIHSSGARFDEELPLYGWLEDVDFCRVLAAHGGVRRVGRATGVHLGIKKGRTSGLRLGYSQMVNPPYLLRKGTCSRKLAFRLMAQNLTANLAKSLAPERYIDRRGRLRGNLRGLWDLATGRARPSRALDL